MNTSSTLRIILILSLLCLFSRQGQAQYESNQFVNSLWMPYLATGTVNGDTMVFNMEFTARQHNFDQNGSTSSYIQANNQGADSANRYNIDVPVYSWAINTPNNERWPFGALDMSYLGPTIKWQHGKVIDMRVRNSLPSNSAATPGHGDFATSHWHGLNVYAGGDGGPHQAISNVATNDSNLWNPIFPMVDPAQTLWYHSHVMDYTTEQVILGLAGLIIVEDTTTAEMRAIHNALPHDYAYNDFVMVLQEKQWNYTREDTTAGGDTLLKANSIFVSEKPGDGEFRMVNGVVNGRLNVPQQVVRFRLLNGDPRKSFNIGFSTNIDTSQHGDYLTFYQVGTDGGYTGKKHPMTSFLINPGERGDFIVDFTGLPDGQEVFLTNLSSEYQYKVAKDIVGLGGDKKNAGPLNPGLAMAKFVVNANAFVPNPITELAPDSLFPAYELEECGPYKKRVKELRDSLGLRPNGKSGMWTIDGEPMNMMKLNDTVCVNTCEQWTIINTTPVAHPFHIHKVQFQIVEYIDGSDPTKPAKVHRWPNLPAHMMGYKDVMIVRKNSQFTFQARFDDFGEDTIAANKGYMYHCHILTHEDFSMMHQFTVVSDSICQANNLTNVKDPLENRFSVYPNPAQDRLFLRGDVKKGGTMRFIDQLGRVLGEEEIAPFNGETMIKIGDLPRGLILVEFTYDQQHFSKKIILE